MIRLFIVISLLWLATFTYAIQPDPIYRETEVRNERPRAVNEKFDLQEVNPRFKKIFSDVDKKAERRVGNVKRNVDFIHRFWDEKKSILHEQYDIQWQSPADLNPAIDYGDYGQPMITDNERESISYYIKAEGYMGNESVLRVWRMFDGTVYVSTKDNMSERIRHYQLAGIGDQWKFVNVHFVEP
ncbi:hypothetical protein [Paraglaciecola sp. MB-3u-78]|jgi:hypothetical protein|uniref:hypothetical protein n=1 Tax=Paraglaciecola sp. MB-3u-78 TaxID=2058332 RepID=UPI000C325E8E|nr:hypothetical protein [Paraglaciecola sp. MB-3u-78]PKH00235.1 hypothetical protein CXF95_06415 [Paraglaciecola sp. MB-3u-78]